MQKASKNPKVVISSVARLTSALSLRHHVHPLVEEANVITREAPQTPCALRTAHDCCSCYTHVFCMVGAHLKPKSSNYLQKRVKTCLCLYLCVCVRMRA